MIAIRTTPREDIPRTFAQLYQQLPTDLARLVAPDKRFPLGSYFNQGQGEKTAFRKLQADGKIPTHLTGSGFSGIYLLYHHDQPIYVGISRHVLRRLKQHVDGRNHYSASLAYRIAKEQSGAYPADQGRDAFPLPEIQRVQDYLLKEVEATTLPIANAEHLYLLELYAAMELATPYNRFETH